jgi:hypothetical protein
VDALELTSAARKALHEANSSDASLALLLHQKPVPTGLAADASGATDLLAAFERHLQQHVDAPPLHRLVEQRLQWLLPVRRYLSAPFRYAHMLALLLHDASKLRSYASHRLLDALYDAEETAPLIELLQSRALQAVRPSEELLWHAILTSDNPTYQEQLLLYVALLPAVLVKTSKTQPAAVVWTPRSSWGGCFASPPPPPRFPTVHSKVHGVARHGRLAAYGAAGKWRTRWRRELLWCVSWIGSRVRRHCVCCIGATVDCGTHWP